jgi:hypothetical protein
MRPLVWGAYLADLVIQHALRVRSSDNRFRVHHDAVLVP